MLNAIRCINQRFAFQNSRISWSGLDIQDKKSEYDSPVSKKLVAGGEIFQWPSRADRVVNLNIPI